MKVVRLSIRNRAVAILITLLLIAIGATFLTVGLALLAGLALTGALVGTGVALYRRLRGKPPSDYPQNLGAGTRLDPSLEVQPTRPPSIAPLKSPDN